MTYEKEFKVGNRTFTTLKDAEDYAILDLKGLGRQWENREVWERVSVVANDLAEVEEDETPVNYVVHKTV